MKLRDPQLFLERGAYRRRRLHEATRLLPILLFLLCVLPPIWMPERFSFAFGTVWIFSSWALIIALTGLLHFLLADRSRSKSRNPDDRDDDA